jgi:putative transposase
VARPLRIEFPGALYHVTARGNERRTIFEDEADPHCFAELRDEVCGRFDWRIHAYCLMGNHCRLFFETAAPTLARGMRQLNGVYSQAFNRRRDRSGHLLQAITPCRRSARRICWSSPAIRC